MNLKKLITYLFNRKSIPEPKKINLTTIRYYLQGNLRSLASNFGITEQHILEEAQWRLGEIKDKSPKCFKEGECIYCQCELKELVLSDAACDHGCYPHMRNKEEWNQFKQTNNIHYVNSLDN